MSAGAGEGTLAIRGLRAVPVSELPLDVWSALAFPLYSLRPVLGSIRNRVGLEQ